MVVPYTSGEVLLDSEKRSSEVAEFEAMLRSRIIGQDNSGPYDREPVPNLQGGNVDARPAYGNSIVPGTDWLWKNTHC